MPARPRLELHAPRPRRPRGPRATSRIRPATRLPATTRRPPARDRKARAAHQISTTGPPRAATARASTGSSALPHLPAAPLQQLGHRADRPAATGQLRIERRMTAGQHLCVGRAQSIGAPHAAARRHGERVGGRKTHGEWLYFDNHQSFSSNEPKDWMNTDTSDVSGETPDSGPNSPKRPVAVFATCHGGLVQVQVLPRIQCGIGQTPGVSILRRLTFCAAMPGASRTADTIP